jgi:proline iminopeptidase
MYAPACQRRDFYPAIEPFQHDAIAVSPLHRIYVEQSGNPKGRPALALHGGPGGGASPEMRRFFDPQAYRVVSMDQRGCGRSTPHAELRENTTWDLIADIETVRARLGIESWVVFGGSWGATLALAYAIKHPERVSALVLWGVFLVTKREVDWFYQDGASLLLPQEFESYRSLVPADERDDLVAAYYRMLTSENFATRMAAARAWSRWEAHACSYGAVNYTLPPRFYDDRFMHAFARIEAHYFANGAFFPEDDWIVRNAGAIRDIPGAMFSGRLDICTPPWAAHRLARVCPKLKLTHVPDTTHTALSEPMRVQISAALDALK